MPGSRAACATARGGSSGVWGDSVMRDSECGMGLLEACTLAPLDRGLHPAEPSPVAWPSRGTAGFGAAHRPTAMACPKLSPGGPSLRELGFSLCFPLLFYQCHMSSAGKSLVRFQERWLQMPGLCKGDSGQRALAQAGQAGLAHLSWQH